MCCSCNYLKNSLSSVDVKLSLSIYQELMFQAHFLDSSLSSSGYISYMNELRATKICQRMEHDMTTWSKDVESQRSKITVLETAYVTDF